MSLRVPSGVTIQLTSTINNIDGSPRIDVTTSSFWDTSNVGAASVSQQGLITTHNTATVNLDNIVHVTITAASGNFISAFLIEVSMSSTPPVIQSYAVWGLSGYGDPGLVTTVNGGATFFAVTASDGAQDWLAGTAVPGTTGTAIVVGVSGNSDGPAVMRTTDKGYTWETTFPRVVQGYPDQGDMRAVAANSTSVVAVGYFPSGSSFPPDSWPAVWRSTDQGSTWTKTLITSSLLFPLGPDQYNTALTNIVWLESISRYVAAGYIIDQAWTAISDDDGITWSVKLQPDQDHTAAGYYTWGGMATDGIHVILIPQRHDHAFVTTDGVTWASHSLQLQYGGYIGQNGMAYGNGIWMVTDDANAVIVSNDIGQTWNEYTIGDGLNFYPGVAFDNQHNLFIAIAYGDPMNWAVSANGQTWTQSSGVQSNQGFFNTQGAFSAPFTATITPPPPVGSATISMLTIAAPTNYRDNPSDANLEPYPFHSGANSSAVGSPAGGNPPTGWFPFTLNNTNHRYSIPYFNNPFDACGKYVLDQTSSAGNWFVDGNGSSGTAHYGASTYPRVLSKADANGGWRHFTPDTTYSSTPGLGNYSGLVTNTNSWTRISTYNYTLQSLIVDHTGTKYGKACAGGTPESNAGQPRIAHFIGHDMPDAPYTAWDRDFTTVTSVKIYNSSNAYVADLAFKQKGTSGLITWLDPAIHAGTDMHVVFTNASSSWKSQNFDIQA